MTTPNDAASRAPEPVIGRLIDLLVNGQCAVDEVVAAVEGAVVEQDTGASVTLRGGRAGLERAILFRDRDTQGVVQIELAPEPATGFTLSRLAAAVGSLQRRPSRHPEEADHFVARLEPLDAPFACLVTALMLPDHDGENLDVPIHRLILRRDIRRGDAVELE